MPPEVPPEDTSDTLGNALPPPRENEPATLRRDIADELSDHLACATKRELPEAPDADTARKRALLRFGNPAKIARRLYLDAMKEAIMKDRIQLIIVGLVSASVVMAGVLGALFGSEDVVWRIIWTLLAMGVAAGILWLGPLLTIGSTTHVIKMTGWSTGLVIVLMLVLTVWNDSTFLLQFFSDKSLILSAAFLVIALLPTIVFLRLTTTNHSSIAGWLGVSGCFLTYLAILAAIWLPRILDMRGDDLGFYELWATPQSIGGPFLAAALCLLGHDRALRWWCWVGVASAGGVAVLLLTVFWIDRVLMSDAVLVLWHWNLMYLLACIGGVIALANLLSLAPLHGIQRWIRHVTIMAGIVTAVLIIVLPWRELSFNDLDSITERVMAAAGVVTACGTLLTLVMARFNYKDHPTEPDGAQLGGSHHAFG